MICSECGRHGAPATFRLHRGVPSIGVALGVLGSFWLAGDFIHLFLEGMQRSQLPYWKPALPLVVLGLAACALATRRHVACRACHSIGFPWLEVSDEVADGRRRFLRWSLAGTVGATAGGLALAARISDWFPIFGRIFLTPAETVTERPAVAWRGSQVRAKRRLGRTGAMVSDVSFGCSRIDDPAVVRLALDRGINYFDTSPDYAHHTSEVVLGEAIRGRRADVFLATKFCASNGHLPEGTSVAEIIRSVDGSLRRLNTDYVDLVHIHSCNRVERLHDENVHEAFDRLKQQGKARFLGVSSHAPNLEEVANAAIDSGRFDVMMLAYHFNMWPNYEALLAKAHAADVGVVAMKTLKGAKYANLPGLDGVKDSYPQSAFRWVLSNPAVSCLVVSIWEARQVDEYLYASGTPVSEDDTARLENYDRLVRGRYCQPHCGECLDACPNGFPIDDVLRSRMYAEDYGWPSEGRRVYGRLNLDPGACVGCAAPCVARCPQEIDIPSRMHGAAQLLA